MSGGVDSSVSAALLVEQGYEVLGIMLRLWSETGQASRKDNRCCTRDQMIDAHKVARRLGIPFEVIDIREAFKKEIVDLFIDGYSRGLTPNPCLACNRRIRFTLLLNEALGRGATHLATGHYAQITTDDESRFELRMGADRAKDQSYVLSLLDQLQLSHAMFPVGHLTKPEVREVASRFGLPVATKGDSQDLCFVADGNYRRFLREHSPETFQSGPIMTVDSNVIGTHTGLADYTIGQRKGLGVTSAEPLYVMSKSLETNTLIVGAKSDMGGNAFQVERTNWLLGRPPEANMVVDVKVRYKSTPAPATVSSIGPETAQVILRDRLPDITPGQGAVFYVEDMVIGGGIISSLPPSVEQGDHTFAPK